MFRPAAESKALESQTQAQKEQQKRQQEQLGTEN
jgi:hypothetical protein